MTLRFLVFCLFVLQLNLMRKLIYHNQRTCKLVIKTMAVHMYANGQLHLYFKVLVCYFVVLVHL